MRIAPHNRLLAALALFGSALVAAVYSLGLGTVVFAAGLIGFGAVAALDIFWSRRAIENYRVVFPEVVRMSKNNETEFTVTLLTGKPVTRPVKLGLLLPPDRFKSPYEKRVEPDPEATRVQWSVKGLRLGRFEASAGFLEIPSVWGFWVLRHTLDIRCEFRVYPDLFKERKSLAAAFLNTGPGVHNLRSMGKGKEFEQLREYLPGDLYEDIHWKATARRGFPVSKIYQIEKTQDLYVMIDASRMSARPAKAFSAGDETAGSADASILEKYILAALSIGLAAQRQGDKFGLGIFSDQVEKFIPAGNRKTHFNLCRDALYTAQSRRVSPDFTEFIRFVGNRIRKRALLIILTHLDDPAVSETLMQHIHILSRRHLVTVNMLNPAGARPLFTGGEVREVETIYEHLGGHFVWNFLRECERSLHRLGIGFFLHEHQALAVNIISQYLAIKKRQIL